MRHSHTLLVGVAALFAVGASGPVHEAETRVVEIHAEGFAPREIEVLAGEEVQWLQVATGPATVTGDDGSFDSGSLEEGDVFSVVFEESGEFGYHSTMGPQIAGVIRVVASEPSPEPTESADGGDDVATDEDTAPDPAAGDGGTAPAGPPPTPAPAATGRSTSSANHSAGMEARNSAPVVLPQAGATVAVVDNDYNPREVQIDPGGSVTWNQTGELPHTVTADDGSFDSGEMGQGDSFSHSFEEPGSYPYYCRFHGGPGGAGMSGVVVVSGEDGSSGGGAVDPPSEADAADHDAGATLADTGATVGPLALAVAVLGILGVGSLIVARRQERRF